MYILNLKQVQIHLICISKIYICLNTNNFIHIFFKWKIFFLNLNLFDDVSDNIIWLLNFKNILFWPINK